MKIIFRIILKMISWILLGYLLLFIVLKIVAPNKVTKIMQLNTYNVSSGSMEPIYEINDMIFVVNTKEDNLKIGDVITFITRIKLNNKNQKSSYLEINVTHYIGNIIEDDGNRLYQTQTYKNYIKQNKSYDVWYLEDGTEITTIEYEQIQGIVIFSIPNIGSLINKSLGLILEPLFYIFVGIFATLIILTSYVLKNRKVEK